MNVPNLYGMSRSELADLLEAHDAPRYHGEQIVRWLYARRRFDPASFTDLPKSLRTRLAQSVAHRAAARSPGGPWRTTER